MKTSIIGENDVNMVDILMLLSRRIDTDHSGSSMQPQALNRTFECKTCNRRFPSFQALGGHRASHKKSKLLAVRHDGSTYLQKQAKLKKPKSHECSICGAEFSVGQALGGHMRRHRDRGNFVGDDSMPSFASGEHDMYKKKSSSGDDGSSVDAEKKNWGFDLNMKPPVENNDTDELRLLTFTLGFPVLS
ncbi:putative Zinc finger protein [Zostera marina]|uniref:Putative Zinc finger protein n=1 Tax=Zostera marina TaxID=29655 RepID=A0A0K9PZJ2_ZOSMR|nr:putative Zinc finger protein [Zostera marina]